MHYMSLKLISIVLLVIIVHAPTMHAAAYVEQQHAHRIEQKRKDKALMQALKTADVAKVAIHLKNGANPNYKRSLSGETALMAAVRARVPRERMFDIVIVTRMLIEHKVNVNAIKTPYDNITALHYVVVRTDITNEVVLYLIKLLLHAGANRFISATSTYAQLSLCEGSSPIEQAANAAKLFKNIFPKLSDKFAVRAKFLLKYSRNRPLHINKDDWLPPADAVTQNEKAINRLRVDDAYRKAQNKGRARRTHLIKARSDLFKEGW